MGPHDGNTVLFIRGGRDTMVLSRPHKDMTFFPVTMEAETGMTKLQAKVHVARTAGTHMKLGRDRKDSFVEPSVGARSC